MPLNLALKLIQSHLVEGEMIAGKAIGLKIDQTLCQDATGTLVMLELETMGVDRVKTKSFARIHWQNLVNFGILPLTFSNPNDYDALNLGDVLTLKNISETIKSSKELIATVEGTAKQISLLHKLSPRQIEILLEGGLINWVKKHAVE